MAEGLELAAAGACVKNSSYLKLVPIRQHILSDASRIQLCGSPFLLLLAWVLGNVRNRLLDQPDHLLLCARVEHVTALAQQRLQVLGHVAAGDVDAADAVGHGEALVDGHGVRHAVARIQNHARRPAAGVEGEDSLDRGVERGDVEGLEEDLGGRVAVGTGVERGFGEEDRVLRQK